MHALLIEDHGLISWLIEDQPRDIGYDSFDIAATAEQAIAAAHGHQPDLIAAVTILEYGSRLAAVRSICTDGAVAVVFLNGDARVARELPGDAVVLEKPFTAAELGCAVERARVPSC